MCSLGLIVDADLLSFWEQFAIEFDEIQWIQLDVVARVFFKINAVVDVD